ncbi:AraC family transcriptional regulator [Vallitaleaceae bacterium 9-2]
MNYFQLIQSFNQQLIQNINEDISIDDLIADQYISKYHFYRIFKAIMGFSVGDYILRIRIYYAAKI